MPRSEAEALDLLVGRVETTLDETGDAFPYFADPDSGEWTTTENGNWCGGHWVHALWLAAHHTDDERFERAARSHTETVVEYMPRESMFCGMNFHYAGFRAHDLTGEESDRELGIEGADAMVEHYHHGARQIPLGVLEIASPAPEFRGETTDEGPSGMVLGAVDNVYTALPVLWRAYRETGDPVYRDTAVSHADRHLDWYVREDGSTWHHAQFDPETGDLVRQYNELAYSDETCWARGQGWCIAGLARTYRETGAKRYLDALDRVVDFYREHAFEDGVPPWDFRHPERETISRDTSAAALAAYGLTRLPETTATTELVEFGESVLATLVEDYLTPRSQSDARPPGMVLEGCYNGPSGFADRNELFWTDYYLLYTLFSRVND